MDAERVPTLAEFLAERMARAGLNQVQLADRADLSKSEVNALVKGRVSLPGPDKRRRLAAALGVRHVDLLVAAGELTAEEVSSVAPRWPSDDARRVELFGIVERIPDGSLPYALKICRALRDGGW